MKTWEEVIKEASKFIIFLESGDFFAKKFPRTTKFKIITDAAIGIDYASSSSFDECRLGQR